MTYLLATVMTLIAVRFFIYNRYIFLSNIKDSTLIYKRKSKSARNIDALLGVAFLMAAILLTYVDKVFV